MGIDTLDSWRDLDDAIAEASRDDHGGHGHSPLVFRGLARSSYTNASSLARLGGDFRRLERHLIRNFRKYAHRDSPGPTMWDWLSLGQHHGLPTRLLDWTFSPLVALHFATASWPEDEAILWAVDSNGAHRLLPDDLRTAMVHEGSLVFTTELLARHARDLETLDGLSEDAPFLLFFEPPSLDERIVNQAAVLSVLSDPTCHLEEWLDDHPQLWHAWRIPTSAKQEIRERLDQAHVTERVLLPGLDGLASWLTRYYSPRRIASADEDGGAFMDERKPRAQREGSMSA
jgi:hypothetical protein